MISKTILITGNHHTPAIELINQLKKDKNYHWQINYVSDAFKSETHILNTIIPLLKINFIPLSSGKFNRRYLPETILAIPKTIKAIIQAYFIVGHLKPDVTVSFGGFVSVPVIIASFLKHIPSLTHEQTHTISLSTKINSLFVNKIALSFKDTTAAQKLSPDKIVVTGNLLRSEIYHHDSTKYNPLEKDLKKIPLLYITGGSQGSSVLNQTIIKILPDLLNKFTIIHHIGKLEYDQIKKNTTPFPKYYPTDYIGLKDIGWVLNNASVIISRAGANTCQEIVALHKKSILIPLPFSQQNEQDLNALWVKNLQPDVTIIIPQSTLHQTVLLNAINQLITDQTKNIIPKYLPNYLLLKSIHELL